MFWGINSNMLHIFCYLHHITTTVFRGERHRTDGGFGSVDAERFSAYLKAEPAGWYALCGNATNVASMLFNPNMDPELWAHAHRCTRDPSGKRLLTDHVYSRGWGSCGRRVWPSPW